MATTEKDDEGGKDMDEGKKMGERRNKKTAVEKQK